MQAVLGASSAAAALEAARHEQELREAYASYALVAHALLSGLARAWTQGAAAQLRPHLALPPQDVLASFMAASTAGAGSSRPSGA